MTKPITLGLLLVLCACGSGSKSNAEFTNAGQSTFEDIELELAQPVASDRLAALKKISVKSFYDSLVAQSTDDPIVINGTVIRDVRTQLKAAEPFFARLGQAYGSWGEFAEKNFDLSVAPGREITREAFTKLTQNFATRAGAFSKLNTLPPVAGSKKSPAQDTGLELADARKDKVNLGALAALSLAIQYARGQGLGLADNTIEATNSFEGPACNKMTDISAVNRIDISSGNNYSLCTGTFFKGDGNYDYLLTADHCTASPDSVPRTNNTKGVSVRGIVVRKAFGSGPAPKDVATPVTASKDLSVIAFPPGTARGYMRLAPTGAKVGDQVKLAGFGQRHESLTVPSDAGVLNCGTNSVQRVVEQQGAIVLTGVTTTPSPVAPLGTASISGRGDSGGPLIRIGADGKPEIIGVASNVLMYNGTSMPAAGGLGNYTDLNSSWSKPFINQRSNLQKKDLPLCTNGSNNGDGTGIQPGIGGLDGKTCLVPPPPQGAATPGKQAGEE